jgi:hypothetical protein
MSTIVDGTTGVSLVQDGVVVQADLAANVAGTGPAFMANGAVSIPTSGNGTILPCDYASHNEGNCYSTTTYKFTPTTAGYYVFIVQADFGALGAAGTYIGCGISRNGMDSNTQIISQVGGEAAGARAARSTSCIAYMNGTTDYAICWGLQNTGVTVSGVTCQFQGYLVRKA